MKIATHQPDFLPYIGLFWKIYCCDVLVILDDVQYSKRGMHDFNYIKTPQGKYKLKVPVSCNYTSKINEVRIADETWYERHLKTLEMNYKRAPYFYECQEFLKSFMKSGYKKLDKLNIDAYKCFMKSLGIEREIVLSSELNIASVKEQRILDICDVMNADVYVSGTGASAYQKKDDFTERGIDLRYAVFEPFAYNQLWGDFIPYLSVVDYIMNCGFDALKGEFEKWEMLPSASMCQATNEVI